MSNENLLNETHNPALTSWVNSANQTNTDFPIQNLPFGIFKVANTEQSFRGGVAIGDQIVDLAALSALSLFEGIAQKSVEACAANELNTFMAMGTKAWSALRLALSDALKNGSPLQEKVNKCLVAQADVVYAMPCHIGDYTDFYTSIIMQHR